MGFQCLKEIRCSISYTQASWEYDASTFVLRVDKAFVQLPTNEALVVHTTQACSLIASVTV